MRYRIKLEKRRQSSDTWCHLAQSAKTYLYCWPLSAVFFTYKIRTLIKLWEIRAWQCSFCIVRHTVSSLTFDYNILMLVNVLRLCDSRWRGILRLCLPREKGKGVSVVCILVPFFATPILFPHRHYLACETYGILQAHWFFLQIDQR